MNDLLYADMNIVVSKFLELFQYSGVTNITTSAFENEEGVFDKLVSDKRFIAEADEAKKQLRENPSNFTNFTQKYSSLIE